MTKQEPRATPLDDILALLAECGPLAYRTMEPAEQAWRGRYLLMVVAMGATPVFAWANALNRDPVESVEARALVASIPDGRIAEEFAAAGILTDELLPYD